MKSIIMLFILIFSCITTGKAQQNTIQNIQKAYQEEANAANQFEAFSDKATKDGYDDLANLFCAMANGEYVQMKNHEKALEQMGKNPEPVKLEEIKIQSSKNNILESIKTESKAKRNYKDINKDAKEEGLGNFSQLFKEENKIEKNHEYLLKKAYFNFDKNIPQDYYVSNLTGEITSSCKCILNCKCEAPPQPKNGEQLMKF